MPSTLTDDELIDMPLANLMPGELKRVFLVQAQQVEKKQEAERALRADLLRNREIDQQERTAEENHRRETQLLAAVQEREEMIERERRELDRRTLRLDDGRRVYVDGDKYRDEKGRQLDDADRAQAELHHLDQPHAATWQEKHELDEQQIANHQLRQRIEDSQAGKAGANEAAQLAQYEKQFRTQPGSTAARAPGAADYADLDYMTALTGSAASGGKKTRPGF